MAILSRFSQLRADAPEFLPGRYEQPLREDATAFERAPTPVFNFAYMPGYVDPKYGDHADIYYDALSYTNSYPYAAPYFGVDYATKFYVRQISPSAFGVDYDMKSYDPQISPSAGPELEPNTPPFDNQYYQLDFFRETGCAPYDYPSGFINCDCPEMHDYYEEAGQPNHSPHGEWKKPRGRRSKKKAGKGKNKAEECNDQALNDTCQAFDDTDQPWEFPDQDVKDTNQVSNENSQAMQNSPAKEDGNQTHQTSQACEQEHEIGGTDGTNEPRQDQSKEEKGGGRGKTKGKKAKAAADAQDESRG